MGERKNKLYFYGGQLMSKTNQKTNKNRYRVFLDKTGKYYVDITATDQRDAIYQLAEENYFVVWKDPDIHENQLFSLPLYDITKIK